MLLYHISGVVGGGIATIFWPQNNANMLNVVEIAIIQNTMLTGFYTINRKYTDEAAWGIQIDPYKDFCHRLYAEMPEHFIWDKQQYC